VWAGSGGSDAPAVDPGVAASGDDRGRCAIPQGGSQIAASFSERTGGRIKIVGGRPGRLHRGLTDGHPPTKVQLQTREPGG
jgi:hypothetical protein